MHKNVCSCAYVLQLVCMFWTYAHIHCAADRPCFAIRSSNFFSILSASAAVRRAREFFLATSLAAACCLSASCAGERAGARGLRIECTFWSAPTGDDHVAVMQKQLSETYYVLHKHIQDSQEQVQEQE